MAYVVVSIGGEELSRHALNGPTVIGRSVDSDISVRDASMSRWHCRVEPAGDPQNVWVVVDLGSRNGTNLNGRRVTRHVLHSGDLLRIGRVTVAFSSGEFASLPPRIGNPELLAGRLQSPTPSSASAAGFCKPLLVPSDRLPRPLPGSGLKQRAAQEGVELLSSPGWSRQSRVPPSPTVDASSAELVREEGSKTVDLVVPPSAKGAEEEEADAGVVTRVGRAIGRLFGR